MRLQTILILASLFVAYPAAAQKIAPSSGKTMCSALTPADFTKVGVDVSRLGSANADSKENVYCTYEGKAKKVEFDIFYPAGETVDEAKNAERASMGDIGGKFGPVRLAGADEAHSNAAHPNAGSASIVVRKGTAVFDINIPEGAKAEQQLEELARTVLNRMK
jgi:hypothetical protein